MDEAALRRLPKAELHCHLDGIADPPMLRELAARGCTLPLSAEELERAYPVHDFDSFTRWFAAIRPLEGTIEQFKPLLQVHLERLKAQGVVYAELMVAGSELPRDASQAVEMMAAFRKWLTVQEGGEIQVEVLSAISRARTPEQMAARTDIYLTLFHAGLLAGFAIAGPEVGYPIAAHARTLARVREAGMPVEIHAGEWAGPESVWDALTHGQPARIGHGVAIFQDQRLLETVLERGLHVEMCPTSNVTFGSLCRQIEQHPIRHALDLGLSLSVNTDDPGASGATMLSEYALLAAQFGFDEGDFRRLFSHTLAARFVRRLRGRAASV